jgi:TfoX/Sxy family transcriptional regulator of competence genes
MAYDEGLAQRIREQLGGTTALAEKRMFGGLAFMENGNMLVGVMGDDLIARVGEQATDQSLGRPGARLFDFPGRPMRGWIVVSGSALDEDEILASWIADAHAYVFTLPAK